MSKYQNYGGLFFQNGDPLGMAEADLQYPGQLGMQALTKCRDGVDRDLQIVQCDSTLATAPTPGMVAYWIDDAEANGTYRVTPVVTGHRGRVAGIFAENIPTLTVDQYTAIVKKGRDVPVKLLDSPTSAADASGKFVVPSATSGRADVLAAGSAATYPPIGRTSGTQDGTTKLANCQVDVYASGY